MINFGYKISTPRSIDMDSADSRLYCQLVEAVPNVPIVSNQVESRQVRGSVVTETRQPDTAILLPKQGPVPVAPIEQIVSEEMDVEQMEPTIVSDDPIVACNSQCSPDSVINDIWKFLRT